MGGLWHREIANQALVTQAILVRRIKSLLDLFFLSQCIGILCSQYVCLQLRSLAYWKGDIPHIFYHLLLYHQHITKDLYRFLSSV